jgi:hypothetical protein
MSAVVLRRHMRTSHLSIAGSAEMSARNKLSMVRLMIGETGEVSGTDSNYTRLTETVSQGRSHSNKAVRGGKEKVD